MTSDHCRVTVQRLFSKFSRIAWNVKKTLFDSNPTVAWPPTTVAWPLSDFFQNLSESLETSKKRCLTVIRRSRDLRPLSRVTVQRLFFKNFPNCLKHRKNVVRQSADGRVTTNHYCLTVQRLFLKVLNFGWIVAWPSGEFVPVVFANDFAYASWHMSLSLFFFFPTYRSAFGIFWTRDSSYRRRPILDFLISNERYFQGEENLFILAG